LTVNSLADLERDWTVEEVQKAHEWLDCLEWAEHEAMRRSRAESERR
jgi:hypothetical protein